MYELDNKLNAGLYSGYENFSKKPWGNDYILGHIKPDAIAYSQFFYAKNHIPGIQNRPGNNSYPSTDIYTNINNYNLQCYNHS
jgi:hypothetical protein